MLAKLKAQAINACGACNSLLWEWLELALQCLVTGKSCNSLLWEWELFGPVDINELRLAIPFCGNGIREFASGCRRMACNSLLWEWDKVLEKLLRLKAQLAIPFCGNALKL